MPPATPSLPPGVEIFQAGTHTDDAGVRHVFSEADVDGMVQAYDPALREAPLTIGHPQDNRPAYGWVQALHKLPGARLAMAPHQVEPQFAEMVQAGRFKKRSASFYPPASPNNPAPGRWYLRHVAFLGAQPPAIAGLKDIQFSEDDAGGAVSFSESASADPSPQEPDPMSKELQAQLDDTLARLATANEAAAAAQRKAAEAEAQAASFAERARADRKAGFVSFAEAQVQAGRLLPKDKDMAVATLQALDEARPVSFAEGQPQSLAQWLQDLIGAARPAVSFGEFAGAKAPGGAGAAKGKSDAEIDQAAQAYARAHQVNYKEALTAVTASFVA